MKFSNYEQVGILILILLILLAGCLSQTQKQSNSTDSNETPGGDNMSKLPLAIKAGSTVQVYYVGYTMENGEKVIFDQTSDGQPAEFQVGVGALIKGFDDALMAMSEGEKKTIEIPPKDAYGEVDEKLIVSAPIADLNKAGISATVGTKVRIQSGQQGIIIDVNATHARVNFNLPLAGKTLFFDLTLVKIVK